MNLPLTGFSRVAQCTRGRVSARAFLAVALVFACKAAAASPTVTTAEASACGVRFSVIDAGAVTIKSGTLTVLLDGVSLTPSVSRSGLVTRLSVEPPGLLPPGSAHTLSVQFTDTTGQAVSSAQDFVAPFYTYFPASAAVDTYDPASSGFKVRTVWMPVTRRGPGDPNSIANAEAELAERYVDAFGSPITSSTDLTGADPNGYTIVPTVNFEQSGHDLETHLDNFDSVNPPNRPQPNQPIPGVTPGDRDNIAAEIVTFLNLSKGCYTLGVNSDDGFVATLGTSAFGPLLGAFNSGRTAGDSIFEIAVEQDGVYPVRLAWWEDKGAASLEFFSIDETGERVLINDRSNPNAIIAYSVGRAPGALLSVGALQQNSGVPEVTKIVAQFRDDLTSVDPSSVSLLLDGEALPVSSGRVPGRTTFSFGPTRVLEPGSEHTGILNYRIGSVGNSVAISFRVRAETAGELPGGLAIEAEHFDFGGGKTIPAVNSIPYSGGEYDGLSAVAEVDYHRSDEISDGDLYRVGELPNVPMEPDVTPNSLDVQRPGGWTVVANHRIGWAGSDWYNYTRYFTNGNYKIYAAQSHGNNAGDPNHLRSRLAVVSSGWGTRNQGVFMLGSYSEPATGGWGNNALVKFKENGADAVVHLGGTNTIRVFIDEGDFDWFAFVPTTEATPMPSVTYVAPEPASVSLASTLQIEVRDLFRDRAVLTNTVRLLVSGKDVTRSTAIARTMEGVHVGYTPAGGFNAGTIEYQLQFGVTGGETLTYVTNFTSIGAAPFIIEGEDFNYGAGGTRAEASNMPLAAALFAGLGGVSEIDYGLTGGSTSGSAQIYRTADHPAISIADNSNDLSRGSFNLASNYRVTRLSPGDWFNYTRTFPAGRYKVWAALSHGDAGPTTGSLHLVTSDAHRTNQVLSSLGTFGAAGGTGGWGLNRFVPLLDRSGEAALVSLSGLQTVRYLAGSGDFDFLAFVPVANESAPPLLGLTTPEPGKLRVTWSNGGILEGTSNVGPGAIWQAVGSGGTADLSTTSRAQYFRVKR